MNEEKLYKLGLICGRFGHIHNGHISLIKHSLTLCEKTLILVGSAQESGTLRNPFSVDLRTYLINLIYPCRENNIIVKGLEDMSNEYIISHAWGHFVKEHVQEYTGMFADLIINGNDASREGWFSQEDLENTSTLVVSRNKIPVSATRLRALLALGNKDEWQKFTPKQIHSEYNRLRETLMNVPVYKQIYNEAFKKRTK